MTRFLLVLAAALCAAPAALADGIAPFTTQGGPGALAPDGSRIVALADGASTKIVRRDAEGGVFSTVVPGAWGVPVATYAATGEGISHDGSTLVLGDVVHTWPHTHSAFLFLDPRTLNVRSRIALHGDFAYDALSPDASRLYLIQHVDDADTTRYVVRAVDTRTMRLLPGRIADRTQRSWVMEGYPLMRVTSSDGRWVYTLYDNPKNVPFIHALDTVRGVAHCVGVPATTDPTSWTMHLHGTSLAVGPWRISTTTWRVSTPHGGFPWWTLWLLGLLPLLSLVWLRARGARAREVVRVATRARRRGPWHRRADRDRRDGRPARAQWGGQVDDARHGARPAAP
jgi:hypothetical protein